MPDRCRKKVLFVIPSLAGGGAERVLLNLLRHLDREKFQLTLALFEKKGAYLGSVPADVTIHDLRKRHKLHLFKLVFLLARRVYPEVKPDAVISFLEYANWVALLSRNLSAGRPPVIISVQNYTPLANRYAARRRWRAWLTRRLYPAADKIIPVSRGVAAGLAERYRIKKEKMRVIYNAVDTEDVTRAAREPVGGDRSGKGRPVIIACGRLTRQKNFRLLLSSFAKVDPDKQARLVILGEGEEQAALERLAGELKVAGGVTFAGFQQNPFPHIAGADIFVLSSAWEGFPNVIIEAMACGVPVIATDCPAGPGEIITDGVNGLLVPAGDVNAMAAAITRLLDDAVLRKRLAAAGRKRAANFRVERMVAGYERVLDEVTAGH